MRNSLMMGLSIFFKIKMPQSVTVTYIKYTLYSDKNI